MKKFTTILLILLSSTFFLKAKAQSASITTDTIFVNGVCEECKDRIESYAFGKGVKKAEWNEDTQLLIVTYDSEKTTSEDIQKRIAKVGHDTEMFKATDKAYNALPHCCQYDRKP